jgi:NTE family protein
VTAVLALSGRRGHLVSNAGLKTLVEAHLQFDRLENVAIPLHLIATDIRNGTERRLSAGDALAAILASAAIPGLYPSVPLDDTELVDGGISNNTPISDAAELGATKIYVLPTGSPCEVRTPPTAAIPILVHSLALLANQRLVSDIERFSHDAELLVLPPPCPLDVLPSDFSHASELMEESYRLATRTLNHPEPAQNWTRRALERLKIHTH